MGLFGRKNKVEPPPIEDMPPLPTIDTLHQEGGVAHNEMPRPQLLAMNLNTVPNTHQMQKPQQMARPMPKEMPVMKKQEPSTDRPAFAPLFVKIDRYRNILSAMGQIRTSIAMIRNSFATLNELEKARLETLKLIEEAVNKVEAKILSLDSEMLRPTGALPEAMPEYHDVETVQATVADLQGQIKEMKSELDRMG